MEFIDGITLFILGLTVGIAVGFQLCRQERKLERQIGFLEGVNFLWPHLARAWILQLANKPGQPAKDTTPGGDGGA